MIVFFFLVLPPAILPPEARVLLWSFFTLEKCKFYLCCWPQPSQPHPGPKLLLTLSCVRSHRVLNGSLYLKFVPTTTQEVFLLFQPLGLEKGQVQVDGLGVG